MTDTPHTLWMAASTRPLDEIETMRCEAPECEIVQEFRALFNEIHRLRAILGEQATPQPSFMDAALHPAILEDVIRGALESTTHCQSPIACSKAVMKALAAMPKAQPVQTGGDRPRRERWNIERHPDGKDLLVCENNHEKGKKCRWERWVPERSLTEAEKAEAVDVLQQGWLNGYPKCGKPPTVSSQAMNTALYALLERFTLVKKP